jgi:hypothetical protein
MILRIETGYLGDSMLIQDGYNYDTYKDAEPYFLELAKYIETELNKRWAERLGADYVSDLQNFNINNMFGYSADENLDNLNRDSIDKMIDGLYNGFVARYERDHVGKKVDRIQLFYDPCCHKAKKFCVYGWYSYNDQVN